MNKEKFDELHKQLVICHNGCTKFDDKSCEVARVIFDVDVKNEVVTPMTSCDMYTGDKSITEQLRANHQRLAIEAIKKHNEEHPDDVLGLQ